MSPELHQRVRKLFEETIEKPEGQRLAFLKAACPNDLETYQGVVEMLGSLATGPAFVKEKTQQMEQMGRYVLTGELGRGAMGVVYGAMDPLIGRNVAIKVIQLQVRSDSKEAEFMRDRLFREARAAGRLFHPGIVVILDVGQEADVAFIAMERVDGSTLERTLASGKRLKIADALDILRQAAAALDYAHQNGVVHRDIKPANIMLHKGTTVKVADFGIAKSMSTEYGTMAGMIMGTPSYMSPEQIEAQPVDGRSDQFSLAVVAYELLSGNRPFQGPSLATLAHMIVYGNRPSIRSTDPTLPPGLDEVLHRGLARKPEERYASCTEFVAALDAELNRVGEVESAVTQALAVPVEEISETNSPPVTEKLITEEKPIIKKRRFKSLWYVAAAGAALVILDAGLFYFRTAPRQRAPVVSNQPATVASTTSPFAKNPAGVVSPAPAATQVPSIQVPSNPVASNQFKAPQVAAAPKVAPPPVTSPPVTPPQVAASPVVTPQITSPQAPTPQPPTPAATSPFARTLVTAPRVDRQTQAGQLYTMATEDLRKGNSKEAIDLFRRAADLGEARAMQDLGEIFMEGTAVAKNDEEAARWFRKGAEKGNASAMLFLGGMYRLGNGVEQSDKEAADWFRKAADAGNPAAMYNLGNLYEDGRGVPRDSGLAKQLYQKAAALGDQDSQKRLNQLH